MESQFLKNEQIQRCIWFRYIDYIFFIWTASEKELHDFLERLNNFHPNLKFTHKRSRQEINFLDVTFRVNHGEFITNLYCKPTDGHQYLHFESCYPSHTKSSIIFSQALRRRRICSKKSDLLPILEILRTGSRKGDIQRIWLTREQKGHLKVLPSLGRSDRSVSGNCGIGVLLVVNYSPTLRRLGQVICKNLCFLYQDEEAKQVFSLPRLFQFVVWELVGAT